MRCLPWILPVLSFLCVGCSTQGSVPAETRKKKPSAEIVYTPADWPVSLKASLLFPSGGGTHPGVLLIYGGSWSSADHRWQMKWLAHKLARNGFVVMTPVYRGSPEYCYPAPVEDLREALRWMRTHAAEFGLRPDCLAVYGFSAGGYLAEMLGTLDGPPAVRVQAVVAASAPSDLAYNGGGPIVARFLGASLAERPDLYRTASPVTHVSSDDPPVFLYQGTRDKTVAPEHSRIFKRALDRAGVPNELHWIEGRGHAGVLIRDGGMEEAAIAFLKKTMK